MFCSLSHFLGWYLDLILLTCLGFIWNDLARMSSGRAPKREDTRDCVPGSWLSKAASTEAGALATFFWKWRSPLGKTKTSPLFMYLEMSFDRLCLSLETEWFFDWLIYESGITSWVKHWEAWEFSISRWLLSYIN